MASRARRQPVAGRAVTAWVSRAPLLESLARATDFQFSPVAFLPHWMAADWLPVSAPSGAVAFGDGVRGRPRLARRAPAGRRRGGIAGRAGLRRLAHRRGAGRQRAPLRAGPRVGDREHALPPALARRGERARRGGVGAARRAHAPRAPAAGGHASRPGRDAARRLAPPRGARGGPSRPFPPAPRPPPARSPGPLAGRALGVDDLRAAPDVRGPGGDPRAAGRGGGVAPGLGGGEGRRRTDRWHGAGGTPGACCSRGPWRRRSSCSWSAA